MRQQPPPHHESENNGVYAFDLKLNVDFNSRHLSLNVPNQLPFSRKVYVPVSNCPPSTNYMHPPQYIPIQQQQIMRNMTQNVPRNQIVMPSPQYQKMPHEAAYQNHKNVESMNTTSFRLESLPQSIQCVICEKVINKEEFSLHLEEHRNKKKDKSKSSMKESEISIRNKNPEAEFIETINNQPQSISFIPHSLNFSQSIIAYPNVRLVSQSGSSSFIPVTNQLTPLHPEQVQYSRSQLMNHPYQQNSFSQTSFNLSHSSMGQQSNMHGNSNSYSRNTPMPIAEPNQHSINSQRQIVLHEVHSNQIPPQRDLNTLHFHRIQSMIIRPEPAIRVDRELEDCGQSIISRNSMPTKYSQLYALEHQLDRKLTYSQQDSSSSDQESIKVYPSRSCRSAFTSTHPELQRSTYTEKLSKTKLPLNYLARQEFITASTHNSNSRKSKGLP